MHRMRLSRSENGLRGSWRGMVALLALLAAPSLAGAWDPSSYEERFVDEDSVHLQDNNVWVYKSSFAERFGMPEKWINDELEGAEAVAYRVEWYSLRQCGFFSDPEQCRPMRRCIFDLYLTDEQSQQLPWMDTSPKDHMLETSSLRFLSVQDKEDSRAWDPEERRFVGHRIGIHSISWVYGPPDGDKVFSGSGSQVRVQAYDRTIYPGLDFLKLSVNCSIATENDNVRLFFTGKFPTRTDYGVTYRDLVAEDKSKKVRRFKAIKDQWYDAFESGDVPHVVALPDGYMARVNGYDREEYAPKSLATEVERRMKSQ